MDRLAVGRPLAAWYTARRGGIVLRGEGSEGVRDMGEDGGHGEPTLREETRAARGRAGELLVSVVLISTLLGLAINLGSSLLTQALEPSQLLGLATICLALAAIAVVVLLPRISTTIREFHEDIEIVLPLLVSAQDVEVIRVTYYDGVTEAAHAVLARRPHEERRALAAALNNTPAGGNPVATAFALELAQFLFVLNLVRESRDILGPHAAYTKLRDVALRQSSIATVAWDALTAGAHGNRYIGERAAGVPEKAILPGDVRLNLDAVAAALPARRKRRRASGMELAYTSLMRVEAGRDTALEISALTDISEHGLPTASAPRRGYTARCILRNARDTRLRELARAEEAAFMALNEAEQAGKPPEAVTEAFAAAHRRLYEGGQRPRLLRVFVRFDGAFRIRLLGNERRQRGLYAWGAALSRLLSAHDIEVFLARLKEEGQRVPRRTF
ncbi:MAG TPA: hypothetical protein VLJ14_00310 [Ktedonobacterales bacterium]|nr:hypothetical protein [Ktedonobacterales bacterium]